MRERDWWRRSPGTGSREGWGGVSTARVGAKVNWSVEVVIAESWGCGHRVCMREVAWSACGGIKLKLSERFRSCGVLTCLEVIVGIGINSVVRCVVRRQGIVRFGGLTEEISGSLRFCRGELRNDLRRVAP